MGMSARLSGAPWLLIEICARSLVTDASAGCSTGRCQYLKMTDADARVAPRADTAWVGIDVGKTHHWACVVSAEGKTLLSVKIADDEAEIVAFLARAGSLAAPLVWALDIIGAPSALLPALLARAGQPVHYASGRVVAAMSAAYVGEGKTDATHAYVIAETARLRRDLAVIDADTDLIRNLAVLTGHRADLIADRVRMINRMRDLMTSVFPSLERAFNYSSHKGALVWLTGYASPDRIRRTGQSRLASWLRTRKVRGCAAVAERATAAAKAQSIVLPGQELTAGIIAELAGSILALDDRLAGLDAQIEQTFAQHPQALIIQSMPGFGPFLGASLLLVPRLEKRSSPVPMKVYPLGRPNMLNSQVNLLRPLLTSLRLRHC